MPSPLLLKTLLLLLAVAIGDARRCGAQETLAYPAGAGAAVAEDGMLFIPPGAMQPADPQAVLAQQGPAPVVVDQQLFANGLVIPAGYQCPTEGHCGVPCIACRQAQFTGWSAGVDLLIFEPYWAGGPRTIVHDDEGDVSVGARVTIGHENARGGGMEFRFGGTNFDELSYLDTDAPTTPLPLDLTTFQFDFDLTQRVWIGDSSIVLGVGPRVGVLNYQFDTEPERQINAGGLGLSATLHRPFWRSQKVQFAAIGFGRGSIMGGEIVNSSDQLLADGTLTILEAGFGLEMRRQLGYGDFVGRLMFESQWWESNLMQPVYFDGLSIRLGYQW